MKRTTRSGRSYKSSKSPYGENGAPGYMRAPKECPERKHRFPGLGECVDLAICGHYCKRKCQEYLEVRKNMKER